MNARTLSIYCLANANLTYVSPLPCWKEPSLNPGILRRTMYPTSCVLPKFYGLPKIHKTGNSLSPIVSSRGSVTYGVAKVLSKVLKPLVGKFPHHIQSSGNFVSRAKGLTLQLGECLSSHNVTSLIYSVPIDPALNIIRDLLEKDDKLNDRTVLSVQNIIELLGFCLHNTYFSFQNKFYEQVEDARQWDHQWAQLLPICLWRVLREKLSCICYLLPRDLV